MEEFEFQIIDVKQAKNEEEAIFLGYKKISQDFSHYVFQTVVSFPDLTGKGPNDQEAVEQIRKIADAVKKNLEDNYGEVFVTQDPSDFCAFYFEIEEKHN